MDAPRAPTGTNQRSSRWARLARKELREILRDRRTLLTLAIMPLLLYPLFGIGLHYVHGGNTQPEENAPSYRVGFETITSAADFNRMLDLGDRVLTGRQRGEPRPGPGEDVAPNIFRFVPSAEGEVAEIDLEEFLRWGQIDLAVRIRHPDKAQGPIEYEIAYDPQSPTAKEAMRYVSVRLMASNLGVHEAALRRVGRGAPPGLIHVQMKVVTREAPKRGFLLAALLPLVLILMTMTGAVYPAIDLTAGERERGTLEMLMATPISRVGLLAAKYVAVLTVAVLTALVNLAMMTITFLVFGGWLYASGTLGLSLGMVPVVLFLVVLFAAFYSAVLLVVASFARSFKEAQAYIVPLTLVSLVPGLLALVPGLELGYGLALVPLLNIVLLARDQLSGAGGGAMTLVVVVVTVVYGYIALILAARTFGAEAVLYTDGRTWLGLFRKRT
jgi:ABC-2 type transport system permease protein/sodium transport system permease protein